MSYKVLFSEGSVNPAEFKFLSYSSSNDEDSFYGSEFADEAKIYDSVEQARNDINRIMTNYRGTENYRFKTIDESGNAIGFNASAKKMKKAQAMIFGEQVEIPDAIECDGGTLHLVERENPVPLYEGKVQNAFVSLYFYPVSDTVGEDLDIFIGNSKSELEDEGYVDPWTGAEGRFSYSEIADYVNEGVRSCRERGYLYKSSDKKMKKSYGNYIDAIENFIVDCADGCYYNAVFDEFSDVLSEDEVMDALGTLMDDNIICYNEDNEMFEVCAKSAKKSKVAKGSASLENLVNTHIKEVNGESYGSGYVTDDGWYDDQRYSLASVNEVKIGTRLFIRRSFGGGRDVYEYWKDVGNDISYRIRFIVPSTMSGYTIGWDILDPEGAILGTDSHDVYDADVDNVVQTIIDTVNQCVREAKLELGRIDSGDYLASAKKSVKKNVVYDGGSFKEYLRQECEKICASYPQFAVSHIDGDSYDENRFVIHFDILGNKLDEYEYDELINNSTEMRSFVTEVGRIYGVSLSCYGESYSGYDYDDLATNQFEVIVKRIDMGLMGAYSASAKKSYSPDYKDFAGMVHSIRNTGNHRNVFKE